MHCVTVAEANRLRPMVSDYNRLLTRSFVRRSVQAVPNAGLQKAGYERSPGKLAPRPFAGILDRGVSIDR